MKLSTRLALLAAVALIPMVVFSGIALDKLLDSHREEAVRGMRETARATSLIIDRELKSAQSALRVLATSPYLAEKNWEKFYSQAKVANVPGGAWIVLYQEDGSQVINTRVPFGGPLTSRPVEGEIAEILQKREPHISNVVWGPRSSLYVIFVDLPIYLPDGRQYVLSQAFNVNHFNIAFADRGIPASWVTGIYDRKGDTIARSQKPAELIGKPAKLDVLEAIYTGKDAELRHMTRDGIDVYDVFTHSALSNWAISIGAPVDELNGAIWRAIYIALGGLFAALLLAAGAAAFVGRGLLKSIEAASQSATALWKREEAPAPPRSNIHEIDQLHDALKEASQVLSNEQHARSLAEAEREKLLLREKAARKQAETESRAKDEFLAMLGHELRNPLSAITSAISLLEMDNIDPAIVERAKSVMRRQTDHLSSIIDDLLDLSRVLSGKIRLNTHALDLSETVKNCVETLRTSGKINRQTLSVHTEPAFILGDSTRIEQIVTNLVDNAIKYTPEDGSITVEARASADEAMLMVKDNGIGIPADLLPLIFDVFVQGENTLERAKGGMGIGLSLVKRLVELHGGSIGAESEGKGKGSTFTVRFPLLGSGKPVPSDNAFRPDDRNYSILLVEDQEDGRELMGMLLQSHGHHVLQAANGFQALQLAAEYQPDYAILDIGLPGMDGYELAGRLRSDVRTSAIKLIALTGYGLQEDRYRALNAGFDLHLAKPLKYEELRHFLNADIAA
jgi:signal transduction histidine kinase/ActR/RegA family two-component response regulator